MASKLKISYNDFCENLNEFQDEINKMNELFDSVSSTVSEISAYWTGNSSDCTLVALSNFIKVFETVKFKNKEYLSFLNTAFERYKKIDENIYDAVGVGIEGLSINGSDDSVDRS